MSWKVVSAMEQRVRMMAQWESGAESVAELCRRYGISRKTAYKWWVRWREQGVEGLAERSRAPQRQAQRIAPAWERAVVEARGGHPTWGPKKLLVELEKRTAELGEELPARSTIGAILQRHGLSWARQPRRRASASAAPLAHATAANRVWAADYKGWFRCGDGAACYPLTISDDYSRYLLRCQALTGVEEALARPVFEAAFREYGMPEAIRTDNGPPFASAGLCGLSHMSVWWLRLGIRLERIEPGQPQQNGRHERLHRTLKAEATAPPAADLRRQQARLDAFRREYNAARPHEALGQATPESWYEVAAPRPYPARLPDYEYPARCQLRRVAADGSIRWNWARLSLTRALRGEQVALEEVAEGVWQVRFCQLVLGEFDERALARRRDRDAWLRLRRPSGPPSPQPGAAEEETEKVLPMCVD
jgi:transposase InsO family protein